MAKMPWKKIFEIVAAVLPEALGNAVAKVEQDATASGPSKKDKAVSIAVDAVAALKTIPVDVAKHPDFVKVVGHINDAIVEAANVAARLADASKANGGPAEPEA